MNMPEFNVHFVSFDVISLTYMIDLLDGTSWHPNEK